MCQSTSFNDVTSNTEDLALYTCLYNYQSLYVRPHSAIVCNINHYENKTYGTRGANNEMTLSLSIETLSKHCPSKRTKFRECFVICVLNSHYLI